MISILSFPDSIFADTNSSYQNNVTVAHLPNMSDKIQEKIILFLKFNNPNKIEYYQYLLDKRLAEIKYAIDTEQIDYVEPTASRYETFVGNLNGLIQTKLPTTIKTSLLETNNRHIKSLEFLRDQFPANSTWWLAIQHDINVENFLEQKTNSF